MTAVAKIHHPLGDIDPVAAYVHNSVDIELADELAGMDAHADLEPAFGFDLFGEIDRTMNRDRARTKKDQRHPISSRGADHVPVGRCFRHGCAFINNILQTAKDRDLLVESQDRITYRVQEKDVGGFQF